MVYLFYNKIW